jgi:hypothetical protein
MEVKVDGGYYWETMWEMSKSVRVEGSGRSSTFVTGAVQNYDSFIICEGGILAVMYIF